MLALCGAASAAQAAQLGLLSQTGLISGRQSFMIAMEVKFTGTMQVTLSDLQWQGKLADLSFSVVDANGALVQGRQAAGQALGASVASAANAPAQKFYDVTTPGAYSIYFSGNAAGSKYNMGLYSLNVILDTVDASPVPLPAAGWLLVSGLGALGAAMRRKRAAAV